MNLVRVRCKIPILLNHLTWNDPSVICKFFGKGARKGEVFMP